MEKQLNGILEDIIEYTVEQYKDKSTCLPISIVMNQMLVDDRITLDDISLVNKTHSNFELLKNYNNVTALYSKWDLGESENPPLIPTDHYEANYSDIKLETPDGNYYTPVLEEFHCGFEYQEDDNNTNTWETQIVGLDNTGDLEFFKDLITEGNIRVKHLDRTDIEELGFEQIEYDTYKKENYYFEFNNEYKTFIYEKKSGMENTLFAGTIKNKSELHRLLKQLNILK